MAHPPKRWTFFLEPLFLIVALILQIFVSVSLPIFKPIDLFALHITDSSTVANQGEIRFGLWGFCFLNQYDTATWDYGVCSAPQIGYKLDPTIVATLGLSSQLYSIITEVLTGFLVIHPVIAGLTLISLVPSFIFFSRTARIVSLIINIVSALLSTVVTAVDLAIIIVAKSKLQTVLVAAGANDLGLTFAILWGNAPWLSLVAVIFLWAAVVSGSIVVCSCCSGSDDLLEESINEENEEEAAAREAEIDAEIEARAEEIAEEREQEKKEERREQKWWRRRERSSRSRSHHRFKHKERA